jgi:cold shock protein
MGRSRLSDAPCGPGSTIAVVRLTVRRLEVPRRLRHDGRGLRDTPDMSVGGVVRAWSREEGWGVIDSQDTPGGCWTHFSSVLVPGSRELRAGQSVTLNYEQADQDGYTFRATEVWPAGQEPYRATEGERSGASGAYRSILTFTADNPDEPSA